MVKSKVSDADQEALVALYRKMVLSRTLLRVGKSKASELRALKSEAARLSTMSSKEGA